MVSSESEISKKAKRPKRDLGVTMPVCQGIALARRYGWLMAMGKEDMLCPLGALTLGLIPAKDKFLDGSFNIPFWVKNQDVRAKISQDLSRLEHGKYSDVIMAPLHRADFEPQVIIIYATPAQLSRLIQSSVCETGETVVSSFLGGLACGEEITAPILTDKCQVIVAGGGDRAIAQAHDSEAAFSVPSSKVERIVRGLEHTHKAGVRYPTTSFLIYQGQFPPAFSDLMDYLMQ